MAAPYRPRLGLLDDQESLAPNLGLLDYAARQGDPFRNLARMARTETQEMPLQSAPTDFPSMPMGPRTMSNKPGAQRLPPMPDMPEAEGTMTGLSPTREGFLAGGIAALEAGPGSAYTGPGPVIAAALRSGLSTFAASKERLQMQAAAVAKKEALDAMLEDPATQERLGPVLTKFARTMEPEKATQLVSEILKQKPTFTTAARDARVFQDGELIAGAEPPEPEQAREPLEYGLFKAGLPVRSDLDTLPPEKREQVAKFADEYRRLTAPRTEINLPGEQRVTQLEKVGVEQLAKFQSSAIGALTVLDNMQLAGGLLSEGIRAGTLAGARQRLGEFLDTTGLGDKNERDLTARTEQYLSAISRGVYQEAQSTGSAGVRGLTDDERKWLMQARGGRLEDTKEALLGVVTAIQKSAYLNALSYAMRADAALVGAEPGTRALWTTRLPDPPGAEKWSEEARAAFNALPLSRREDAVVKLWRGNK